MSTLFLNFSEKIFERINHRRNGAERRNYRPNAPMRRETRAKRKAPVWGRFEALGDIHLHDLVIGVEEDAVLRAVCHLVNGFDAVIGVSGLDAMSGEDVINHLIEILHGGLSFRLRGFIAPFIYYYTQYKVKVKHFFLIFKNFFLTKIR